MNGQPQGLRHGSDPSRAPLFSPMGDMGHHAAVKKSITSFLQWSLTTRSAVRRGPLSRLTRGAVAGVDVLSAAIHHATYTCAPVGSNRPMLNRPPSELPRSIS